MIHNSGVNKGILNSIDMRYKFHVDFVGGTSWMLYLCTASLLAQFTPFFWKDRHGETIFSLFIHISWNNWLEKNSTSNLDTDLDLLLPFKRN